MAAPAWHPDPTGRFEYRYWDGSAWTDHVATGGAPGLDPPVMPPAPTIAATATTSPVTPSAAPTTSTWAERGEQAEGPARSSGRRRLSPALIGLGASGALVAVIAIAGQQDPEVRITAVDAATTPSAVATPSAQASTPSPTPAGTMAPLVAQPKAVASKTVAPTPKVTKASPKPVVTPKPKPKSATSVKPKPVAAKTFKNCAQMNAVYPHGVGRPGAKDETSGKPVTTFKVDAAIYAANTGRDRDKDGIACEKK